MKSAIIKSIIWIALCISMFSFKGVGGEGYTIHVNNKLVVEHYVTSKSSTTPSFSLDHASVNAKLLVSYNECGQVGKKRSLTLKDDKGIILKKWDFTNAAQDHAEMRFNAKDVFAFKQKSSTLKLFYDSDKVTGRLLATIILGEEIKAKR